jgi:hypothetical protein
MKLLVIKSAACACILFSLASLLGSCSEETELSPEEKVRKLLTSATWKPASGAPITLEGIDVQDELFSGFTIKFTKDRVITTGTSPVWLRDDTWRFKGGSNATVLIRGMDDIEISIVEVSNSQLKLTLEWDQTTFEPGRLASLPGTYEFTLRK